MKNYVKNIYENEVTISFEENGVKVCFNETPGNRHYEEYLLWLAEGNTPEVIND